MKKLAMKRVSCFRDIESNYLGKDKQAPRVDIPLKFEMRFSCVRDRGAIRYNYHDKVDFTKRQAVRKKREIASLIECRNYMLSFCLVTLILKEEIVI